MKAIRDPAACLLIKVHVPSGCTDPRVDATLCARASDDQDTARDYYPRSPDEVNGLACNHGNLGFHAWAFNGKLSGTDGPAYQSLSYVNAYKLEAYARTLRTLAKRLDKMADTRGGTGSWADYALRFAEACGAEQVCFPVEVLHRIDRHNERPPTDTDGRRWTFVPIRMAAHMLRDLEASFDVASPAADRAIVRSA